LQELCAGSSRKEEGEEAIPRKLEKRGDSRNACRNRNCVQESSIERRLREMCAGNIRKEEGAETMSRKREKRGDVCRNRNCVYRKPQEREGCRNFVQGIAGRNNVQETAKERRWQGMCALNSKRSRLQEPCAGSVRKEEGAETISRKREKRGDGRSVQEQELCAGNLKREKVSGTVCRDSRKGIGKEVKSRDLDL
jgi:hypothetical protein